MWWIGCAGVHVDPGVLDAREDTHAGLRVSSLRQAVLAAVAAAGSRAHAHRRAAVPLSAVLQDVRRQVQPSRARPDALGAQAVRVRALRQGVRAQELPVQARGVVVHARRSRRDDDRVPAETAAAGPRHFRLRRPSVSHAVAAFENAIRAI